MKIDVTAKEAGVIQHLRALKSDGGHGTLRVDVADGAEILLRREHSVKDLTTVHPAVIIPT